MKRRTNRILSILIVVLSLALLAGAGFLLVQVLPQKAPQEVTSLETNSVFEKEDAVVEPEREQAYEGEIPPAAETQPEPDTQPSVDQPEQTESSDTGLISAEADKRARTTLASMTADEKIWQLFYVTPELLTGVETATRAGDSTKQALEEKPVGGIIYFAKNLESRAQTQEMLHNTKAYTKIPLFLGTDEEGGTVSRVGSNPAMGAKEFPRRSLLASRQIRRPSIRRDRTSAARCTPSASTWTLRPWQTYPRGLRRSSVRAHSDRTRSSARLWYPS